MIVGLVEWTKSHFSDLLSVLGVLLTVHFSIGAKKAATAAQDASTATRIHIGKIEAAGIIRECLYLAEGLIAKVDSEQWETVSEKSALVRKNLVTLKHASRNVFDASQVQILEELVVQFRIVTEQADKVRHGQIKSIRKSSILGSLHMQIDSLVAVQEYVKAQLGESS